VLGHRLVFAADEYYLRAGRPFPPAEAYEGFPMHEDGVGMARKPPLWLKAGDSVTVEIEKIGVLAGSNLETRDSLTSSRKLALITASFSRTSSAARRPLTSRLN
jgi:hypothetical protein